MLRIVPGLGGDMSKDIAAVARTYPRRFGEHVYPRQLTVRNGVWHAGMWACAVGKR